MFHTNTSGGHHSDYAGDSLEAGLLTTTITTSSGDRYKRLWQRGNICVGLLITLNKKSSRPRYAALSSTTTTGEQLSRTSSSASQFVIDIRSLFNSEEEEDEPSSVNDIGQLQREQWDADIGQLQQEQWDADEPSSVNDIGQLQQEQWDIGQLQQEQWDAVNRLVKEKDPKSLRDFGGAERVAAVFNSNLVTGLRAGAANPEAWNTTNPPVHGLMHYFIKACNSYTIFLLLISATLSLVTGMLMEGPKYGWLDGVTILVAVFLLVTVPAVVEFYGTRKLEKKMRRREKKVEVIRGGEPQHVAVSSIMMGDIVCLKEGDRVPGDGLFVDSNGLVLDEVLDSNIDRDQNPFLFSGFKVVEGNGRMIVTSVGANTMIGKVMSMVKDGDDPKTETLLQARIERFISYTDKIALCISILITLVLLIQFLRRRHGEYNPQLPELKAKVPIEMLMKIFERILLRPRGLVCNLTITLTVVVLGFHYGVPLAITVPLSYWNQKITSSDHANPQTLSACGTMGFISIICIDVFGGVMFKQMEVDKFFVGDKEIDTEEESNISQVFLEALQQGIGMSMLVREDLRSPMDNLLYSWAQSKWGVAIRKENFDICKGYFGCAGANSSTSKGRGVLMRKNGDDVNIMHMHWRGSAQTILNMCSHYYDCQGTSHALQNQRSKFEELIKGMEDTGVRSIAFAYKLTDVEEIREDELILLALIGVKFREETNLAIESLKTAGVDIKLMMGDGRSLPEDKLLLIQNLKKQGHVVAFYGGLTTSDTPALKEADVGITEEIQSTEMARECCDIIITSGGGLSSLTPLLKHGRCVYHNIEKFIELQLPAWMSGILITAISTIFLGESPITAIQLIYANLIFCTLSSMMMVMEPPTRGLMAHQPQATRTKSVMTKVMWRNFVVQVLYQVSVLLIVQFKGQAIHNLNQNIIKTMIFNTFILCQVFNLFNAMELEKKEMFMVAVQSYGFLASVGAVLVVHVLLVQRTTILTNHARMNWMQWAFCFLFSALSWGFDRILKFISVFLNKLFVRSLSSRMVLSARTPSPYLPYMGFIFSMFLFFSFSYYFKPDVAWTMR